VETIRDVMRPLAALSAAVVLGWAAAAPGAPVPKVAMSLRPDAESVARGSAVGLAVEAVIAEGWHINGNKPDQPYLVATTLTVTAPAGVTVDPVTYPRAEAKTFAFAGGLALKVYDGAVPMATAVRLPADFAGDRVTLEASLRYQACDDTTCLPPTSITATLELPVAGNGPATPPRTGGAAGAGSSGSGIDLGRWLAERGLVFTLAAVALLGLGLNLTPCVYPLISVTIAYFGGQGRSRGRVAWLAALYVLGIAVSFSLLGLAAALSGGIFGAALQRPAVVLFIATVMVVLALGSFGVYQFRPPMALMRWAGGSASGAAGSLFMGLTMGIVAAPCVGPIVVGLLVFVGSRQDPWLGLLLFFTLALGMGLPYLGLALAASSLGRLPRSGEWLVWTEHLFGCVLLCLAVYYVAPLLPPPAHTWALPSAIAIAGVYLGFLDRAGRAVRGFQTLKAAVGVVMLALAAWLIRPADPAAAIAWEPINHAETAPGEAAARPVLLEFGAEWCIPCREMDATTYVHPAVVQEAGRFRMLKADITEESAATSTLTKAYDVKGVPTVILFAPGGDETHRLVGYIGPDEMLAAMRAVR